MSRKPLAAVLALLSAALVLGGNAPLDAVSATVKTTNFAIAH